MRLERVGGFEHRGRGLHRENRRRPGGAREGARKVGAAEIRGQGHGRSRLGLVNRVEQLQRPVGLGGVVGGAGQQHVAERVGLLLVPAAVVAGVQRKAQRQGLNLGANVVFGVDDAPKLAPQLRAVHGGEVLAQAGFHVPAGHVGQLVAQDEGELAVVFEARQQAHVQQHGAVAHGAGVGLGAAGEHQPHPGRQLGVGGQNAGKHLLHVGLQHGVEQGRVAHGVEHVVGHFLHHPAVVRAVVAAPGFGHYEVGLHRPALRHGQLVHPAGVRRVIRQVGPVLRRGRVRAQSQQQQQKYSQHRGRCEAFQPGAEGVDNALKARARTGQLVIVMATLLSDAIV